MVAKEGIYKAQYCMANHVVHKFINIWGGG